MKDAFIGLTCVLLTIDLVARFKENTGWPVFLNAALLAFGLAALLWR